MHEAPDFETVVEYIKTGLKRKTSLDRLRGILSNNKIEMSTIDRAVVEAIDQLDKEKSSLEHREKIPEIPSAEVETTRTEEKRGHKFAIIFIFMAIFFTAMLLAPRINQNEGSNDNIANIGVAVKGFLLNQDYYACCKNEFPELAASEQYQLCKVGADVFEDYEIFAAAKSRETVSKILTIVQNKCETLPETLKSSCSEKTPSILASCYQRKNNLIKQRSVLPTNP